jgi:hypothetical protein
MHNQLQNQEQFGAELMDQWNSLDEQTWSYGTAI